MGRRDEAADCFRRAIELRPGFAGAHNNLGNLLRESGRAERSARPFPAAIELDPAMHLPTPTWARCCSSGASSRKLCRTAKRPSGWRPVAALHHNLGNVLRELGQFEGGQAAYLQAIRLDPTLAKAHAHLGLLFRRQGRLEDALACLKRAIELDPAEPDFPEFLGDLCMDRLEFAEAINCYRRAIAIAPKKRPACAWRWAGPSGRRPPGRRLRAISRGAADRSPVWPPSIITLAVTMKSWASWARPKPPIATLMHSTPAPHGPGTAGYASARQPADARPCLARRKGNGPVDCRRDSRPARFCHGTRARCPRRVPACRLMDEPGQRVDARDQARPKRLRARRPRAIRRQRLEALRRGILCTNQGRGLSLDDGPSSCSACRARARRSSSRFSRATRASTAPANCG